MFSLLGWLVMGSQHLWADSPALKTAPDPPALPALPALPAPVTMSPKVGPPPPPEANRRASVQWLIAPRIAPRIDPRIDPSYGVVPPRLKIQLTKLLSPKQVNLLEGGFTTVSQLLISEPKSDPKKNRKSEAPLEAKELPPDDEEPEDQDDAEALGMTVPLRQVSCSVKFDAWQESFEVIKLMDHPEKTSSEAVIVKDLDAFGELCLTAEVEFNHSNQTLLQQGGVLLATMIVRQTSQEETAKIKGWLIKQQSGVIQGLFSHMLGELTLQQKVHTELLIPPAPASPLPSTPGRLPPRTQQLKKPKIAGKGGADL